MQRSFHVTLLIFLLILGFSAHLSYADSSDFSGRLAFGQSHTMALKEDGTLYGWGANTYGQLGDQTQTNQSSPKQIMTGIASVWAGWEFTLAIKDNGTVWSWGRNDNGQLGIGTTSPSYQPQLTPAQISISSVTQIAAGWEHALALKSDGTVWAWGSNSGRLGNGSDADSYYPVQVQSLTDVKQISAGNAHSIAVKNDGTVWTWGSNWSGQLGLGTTETHNTPQRVTGVSDVIAVAAGHSHSLALKSNGTVWAWGDNDYGSIGDGTKVIRYAPVNVPNLSNVVAIAASRYSSFAVTGDGRLWAWGSAQDGKLGTGSLGIEYDPVQVDISGVMVLAAGGFHTMAWKSDGSLSVWGLNNVGQLGLGTTGGEYSVPESLSGFNLEQGTVDPTPTNVPVITSSSSASGTVGQAFEYQIVATNSPTSYSAQSLPSWLNVNPTTGLLSGTPTEAGVYQDIRLYADNSDGRSATFFLSITIAESGGSGSAPVISSSSSASGVVGSAFTYQISATNTPTSYAASNLPSWLSVNSSTGELSGVPTASGAYSVTIQAMNAYGTGSASLTISVSASSEPAIISSTSSVAYVGADYQYQIEATQSPTSYGATALPDGLSLDSATGVISGIPIDVTADGQPAAVVISAYYQDGSSVSATLLITIGYAAPQITLESAYFFAYLNADFSMTINADYGPTGYSAFGLPPGISVDEATGVVSGVPSTPGLYQVTVGASNTTGSDSADIYVFVMDVPVVYNSSSTTEGYEGLPFSLQIVASNNPVSFTADGLPSGVSLNSTTGLLSGAPTIPGTYDITVSAQNPAGESTPVILSITVYEVDWKPVYRFYNSDTGTHFLTMNKDERDSVLETLPNFVYEGEAFYAVSSAGVEGLSPVYRFYNTVTGTHFFTISEAEKDSVIASLPDFNFEGVAWYASLSEIEGSSAMYRFYNTETGTHFYTISAAERDSIIANYPQFNYEGIGYFAWTVGSMENPLVGSWVLDGNDTVIVTFLDDDRYMVVEYAPESVSGMEYGTYTWNSESGLLTVNAPFMDTNDSGLFYDSIHSSKTFIVTSADQGGMSITDELQQSTFLATKLSSTDSLVGSWFKESGDNIYFLAFVNDGQYFFASYESPDSDAGQAPNGIEVGSWVNDLAFSVTALTYEDDGAEGFFDGETSTGASLEFGEYTTILRFTPGAEEQQMIFDRIQ